MNASITKFPNFLRAREGLLAAGLTLQQGGFDARAKYRISAQGGAERYCNTLREVEAIAAGMAADGLKTEGLPCGREQQDGIRGCQEKPPSRKVG
jgi:hypothetical protein